MNIHKVTINIYIYISYCKLTVTHFTVGDCSPSTLGNNSAAVNDSHEYYADTQVTSHFSYADTQVTSHFSYADTQVTSHFSRES